MVLVVDGAGVFAVDGAGVFVVDGAGVFVVDGAGVFVVSLGCLAAWVMVDGRRAVSLNSRLATGPFKRS
jgi:hypothetical protein